MIPGAIIIHHSLTKDSNTVSWGAIRKWHKGEHPDSPYKMNDVGYHYGIELIDDYYEILIGRLGTKTGAHCKEQGMNTESLGICLVGNFDMETPPQKQWDTAVKLVQYLMNCYGINKNSVFPHRHFAPYKSCPGKLFDMERFIKALV